MKRLSIALIALGAVVSMATALAEPEYVTVEMDIDVARPADEVWTKIGGYCDIAEWLDVDCEITSGEGGIGTVRVLAGGRVTEVLVGKTDLSYGYTQPVQEGRFYDLYHGYLEAKPVTGETSKLVYTLVYDISDEPDQAAKDADMARRREMFEGALESMREIAEAD